MSERTSTRRWWPLLLVPALALAGGVVLEQNTDRPGGELLLRQTNVPSAAQCSANCQANPACVAFTWVKPGVQGPTGNCWLKKSVSGPVASTCCVSGVVRQAAPDACKWHQQGTTYSCHCQSSTTKAWYQTNPGACANLPKPPPRYIDQRKDNCPPGMVFHDAPFGQGYCAKK